MNGLQLAESRPGEATEHPPFLEDLLAGLSRRIKSIPCKYLYDERGSRLFEAICGLAEYYPTRTETGILRRCTRELAALAGPRCNLVDLGSGSGMKTRLLLDFLDAPASCVPIDISAGQLIESAAFLERAYPGLTVLPVCADYTEALSLPDFPAGSGPVLVFFPGSTLGNFEPDQAEDFLRRLGQTCGQDGGVLIGIDLKKDPSVIRDAYNDSQGITAEFDLNVLVRANRELGAGFEIGAFEHKALYNERAGRIEMRLLSRRQQVVRLHGWEFWFEAGEAIVTEHSYKYTIEEFRRLAERAGLESIRCWTDARAWFSVHFLRPA